MLRKKFKTYNNGYLKVCRLKAKASSFGAPNNPSNKSDIIELCKLAYEIMSKRDKDLDFAEADGHSLSLKVRTVYCRNVEEKHHVLIGKTLYNIYKLDANENLNEMYLYLEEVRKLD